MIKLIGFVLCLLISVGCAPLPLSKVPPISNGKSQSVVFDIDGTLTPAILSIYTARPYAAEVAHQFAKKGYQIFYVSARALPFQSGIPGWLEYHGFPAGSLHLPASSEEQKAPAEFKAKVLTELHAAGWRFSYAYGDQETDVTAYLTKGLEISRRHIFGLRRDGCAACAEGFVVTQCLKGWEEHLVFVANVPAANKL